MVYLVRVQGTLCVTEKKIYRTYCFTEVLFINKTPQHGLVLIFEAQMPNTFIFTFLL